ncbi:MAG: ABC-F family ATP-binding cassette domain-containing protein, partial [Planctomycetota bacterium]
MIEAEGLRLNLGGRPILDDVSFRLGAGQRVCLAGRNGQGKSTLMRVLLGQTGVERGEVRIGKGRTIGYLPQDLAEADGDRVVVEEVLDAIPGLARLEHELLEVTEAISRAPHDEALLTRYGKAQAGFEALDGYAAEARARTILDGLGFSQERMNAKLETLSGGWRMRVFLARLLLTRPDALLLDEPTNHLDLESREWLLGFLATYEGALLLTSHDRYFLDHLVDRVFELEGGALTVYTGDYSSYERQRVERIEHIKAAHARQQRELKRQQEFIDRNRAKAATASNVQSRIKQLARIERIELPYEPPTIKLRFPEPRGGGQLSFRLQGVAQRYGELEVFSGLDLEVPTGEKLAVVGKNGA